MTNCPVLGLLQEPHLSKDFKRDKNIDEFEADDGKLLKEEMEFAAEKTVSDFIAHLNGENLQEYAKQKSSN